MSALLDLCRFYSTTTGTGTTVNVGSAVSGFATPAQAGAVDGKTYSYTIFDPNGGGWEKGTCVYNASGPNFTRTTLTSSNSNNPINLSGNQIVTFTALTIDLFALAGGIGAMHRLYGGL